MSIVIKDGRGTGRTVGVTSQGRIRAESVATDLLQEAVQQGKTFTIASNEVAISAAGESGILFLKNNEEFDLLIDGGTLRINSYVGTAGEGFLKTYRNPRAGTVISTATEGIQQNRNFGSSESISADIFAGFSGATFADAGQILTIPLPSNTVAPVIAFDTNIVLPRGASVGFSYVTPSGMTSVSIYGYLNVTKLGDLV